MHGKLDQHPTVPILGNGKGDLVPSFPPRHQVHLTKLEDLDHILIILKLYSVSLSHKPGIDLITFNMSKQRIVPNTIIYIWCFKRTNFPKLQKIMSKIDWAEKFRPKNMNEN